MKLASAEKIFDILALIAVPVGLYFAFVYAPMEIKMGAVQKIFYFHVSSAWVGFFAFFVTFVMSIMLLFTKNYLYDDIAEASAVVGVIFCTIVIVTGPIWARPTWGVWWTWDPRLTSTLILWFVYISYIMLRKFIDDADRRAKFSAALGIIGFIDVPIVFLSIRWWRTIHPNVVQQGGGGLHPDMKTAMFVCLGVFTILYVCMMIKKLRLTWLERRVKTLEN
ncbi:MAG: cytochrome c biogenesis protein CcsA [Deferribacterales bacterium]|nr:cytochrome c biogenesis protein CcsA [Deferribacterales bacterium]